MPGMRFAIAMIAEEEEPVLFQIIGPSPTGAEELERITKIDGYAKQMLANKVYDRKHHLEEKTYRIALLPVGKYIRPDSLRSEKMEAVRSFRKGPPAGIALAILREIEGEKSKNIEFDRIVIPHIPIADSAHYARVFVLARRDNGFWLHGFPVGRNRRRSFRERYPEKGVS